MKSYTFHITLYDLAFLGVVFIGLNFAALLGLTKSINRVAKRFLGLALVVMVLWMVRILAIDIQLGTHTSFWSRLPLQFSLALGPLIFFYVLKLTRPERRFRWNDLLHFIPVLLELGVQLLAAEEGERAYDKSIFRQLNPVLELLTFISVIFYLYRSHRLIEDFYQRLKFNGGDRYRTELQWLHRLLVGFGLLWLLWIPYAAVNYFGYHNRLEDAFAFYPLCLVLAATIIWIGAVAFLRPELELPVEVSPDSKIAASTALRQKGVWLKKTMEAKQF